MVASASSNIRAVWTQIISRSLVFGSSSLAGKDFVKGLAALNMGGDDRTEMENREGILLVKEMVEQQKVRTRELALDSLMSKYEKKPSTKRALRFVKKLQYFLEDVSELLALDGDGKFVNNDTVGEANLVIKKVHSLMRDVKVEVQKEYDDVVMAAHSELGWKTVNQFRGDFGIPEDVSQEVKDLRKYEKEALTLAKEKRAAVRGARGGFSYSYRGRYTTRGGRGWKFHPYSSRGRGAAGSGGSVSDGGASKRGKSCYKCGSNEHLIANCKQ